MRNSKIFMIIIVMVLMIGFISVGVNNTEASLGDFFIFKWFKNIFNLNKDNSITGNSLKSISGKLSADCIHKDGWDDCNGDGCDDCNLLNGAYMCYNGKCVETMCHDKDYCKDYLTSWQDTDKSCGAYGALHTTGNSHACSHSTLHGCCDTGFTRVKAKDVQVCCRKCESGWANCDNNWDNGCEVNLKTDPNNCGSCAHKCANGKTCENGVCISTTTSDCKSENQLCTTNSDCCEGLICIEADEEYSNEDPFFNTHSRNIKICKSYSYSVGGSAGNCPSDYIVSTNTITALCEEGECGSLDADSFRDEYDLTNGEWRRVQNNRELIPSCLARPGYVYNEEENTPTFEKYEGDKKIDDTHIRKFFLDGCFNCPDRTTYKDFECPNNLKVKLFELPSDFYLRSKGINELAYCPTSCSQDSDCVNNYYCSQGHCCPTGTSWDGVECTESNRCSDDIVGGTGGWVFRDREGYLMHEHWAACYNINPKDKDNYHQWSNDLSKCFGNDGNIQPKETGGWGVKPYRKVCVYKTGTENCEGDSECGHVDRVILY